MQTLNMWTLGIPLLMGFRKVQETLLTCVSSPCCWTRQPYTWYSRLEFWTSPMWTTVKRAIDRSDACSIPSIARRVWERLWPLVTKDRYTQYLEHFLMLISRKFCKEYAVCSWQRVWSFSCGILTEEAAGVRQIGPFFFALDHEF